MKKLKLLVVSSLFFFVGCKNPPNVSPCLIQAPGLPAIAKSCISGGKPMNDPDCMIDVRAVFAHCSPAVPTSTQKPHDISIYQMDKYTAFSDGDAGTLFQWIVQHDQ